MVKDPHDSVVERAPAPERVKPGDAKTDKPGRAQTGGAEKAKGNGDDFIEESALSGARPVDKNEAR